MKSILISIILILPLAANAGCKDVGNVVNVFYDQGTTAIETSDGYYGFSKMLPVGKSNDRGRACYNNNTNTLCFPTSKGQRCEKVQ